MFKKLLGGEISQPLPELPLVFALSHGKSLHLTQNQDPTKVWRYLSHLIRRSPHNLSAHVQRIFLSQNGSLKECLAGSLQDLFIALGDAGHLLRERMFQIVKPDLEPTELSFFETWLGQDLIQPTNQQWHKGSQLCTGLENQGKKLVTVERTVVTEYANIMDEVFACLEYGQIDTARELLEGEILAGRIDHVVEQELINIYQYTRDKERLAGMVEHIKQSGQPLDPIWIEKQLESDQW